MSQHKGTSTFIVQRATAVLIAPLAIWFLFNVVSHLGASHSDAYQWVANPWNGVPLFLLIAIGAIHMRIGMGEIIADYIHSWTGTILNLLNWLAALALIGASGWALFSISFAG